MMRKLSAEYSSGLINPDEDERPAFVLSAEHPSGNGAWHSHKRTQLVHASAGAISVHTRRSRWVVPVSRAIWIPGEVEHCVTSRHPYQLLTLYVESSLVACPTSCTVVAVDRLAEELLRAASGFDARNFTDGPDSRLIAVLLDRLAVLDEVPILHIPSPTTSSLHSVVEALQANPGDPRTIDQWSTELGVSRRTLARRFAHETGMSFSQWRQHLRLLTALELLGGGSTVTEVAYDVGYDDVSSFIALFKKALGTTPAKYFSGSCGVQ